MKTHLDQTIFYLLESTSYLRNINQLFEIRFYFDFNYEMTIKKERMINKIGMK